MKPQEAITHEKRVKVAKVLLLTIFFVLTALILLLPFVSTKTHENLKIISDSSGSDIQASEAQTILKPKFYGFDNSNKPYTITADSGVQIDKDTVELQNVFSDIKFGDDKNYLTMVSDKANVSLDKKTLDLSGNIEINIDSDYKVNTELATVDYGEKVIKGGEVSVKGDMGDINAQGFSIDESYKVITFKDRVHTTLNSK